MTKNCLLAFAMILISMTTACEVNNLTPTETGEALKKEQEEKASELKEYKIRSGEQHATLSFETTELTKLKFKALFDSSAIYRTVDAANQGDINKLYGVSDCNSYHHNNSARFGWRWHQNQLEIWAYCYVNGERFSTFLDTVALGEFNEYEIMFEDDQYVFRLNNKKETMARACQAQAKGYKLFPYFGGDEAAPQNISIWIEELKD